jgi:hypothetical protein
VSQPHPRKSEGLQVDGWPMPASVQMGCLRGSQGVSTAGKSGVLAFNPVALCVPGQGLSCVPVEGMETRQRRLEGCSRPQGPGLPPAVSTGRFPVASEDGHQGVPKSESVAPKPSDAEPSRETALAIALQVTVPFMFAGLGLSGAGMLLNHFQVRGS